MFLCCRQNIFLQNCRKFSLRSRIITDNLAEKLNYYQNEQSPTSFSIQQFVDLSQDRASLYNLVRREIPTRISRVINELPQYFPPAVYDQRTAQFIQDYFEMTFKEIETLPDKLDTIDNITESQFLEVLVRAGIRLGGTTEMISEALISSNTTSYTDQVLRIQPSLRRLFHQNVSIDVLVNVYKPKWTKKLNTSTCIDPSNDVIENLERAYEDARYLCEQHYINAPELQVESNTANVVFPYIPSHLYLIFFEVFKNSLRATCEGHEDGDKLPPILITVDKDDTNAIVTITDFGTGMTEDNLSKAKLFFSSSAVLQTMSLYQGAHSSPLAGFGFGIGMVEIFTQYFGGSMNIVSTKGEGTTVQICLPCDPSQAYENLHCFVNE